MSLERQKRKVSESYSVDEPEDAIQVFKKANHNGVVTNTGYYPVGPTLTEQLVNRAANWAFEKSTTALENWWNSPSKRPAENQLVPSESAKRVTTTTTTIPSRSYSSRPTQTTRRTITKMVPKSVKYSKKSARRYYKKATAKRSNYRPKTYFGHTATPTYRGAGEYKYIDTPVAGEINTTAKFDLLDIVQRNNSVFTRDGQRWAPKKLRLRGHVTVGTTGTTCYGRIYVIWDYEPKLAQPAFTDIFTSAGHSSLPNRDNIARFRILKCIPFNMSGNSATPATGLEVFTIDEYLKLPKGLVCVATAVDTTGVIGTRVEGALWMVCIGSSASGTAAPVLSLNTRLNFSEA